MPLFVNVLITNPDEALHHLAKTAVGGGILGQVAGTVATAVLDDETFTTLVSDVVQEGVASQLDEYSLRADVITKHTGALYFTMEVAIRRDNLSFFDCCSGGEAGVYVIEKIVAGKLPSALLDRFHFRGIQADIRVLRDRDQQDRYEKKVSQYVKDFHDQHHAAAGSAPQEEQWYDHVDDPDGKV